MTIKEKLIKEYPLNKKMDCELECYFLDSGRYLIFWEEPISKDSIENLLKTIEEIAGSSIFNRIWKTFIVVGKTNDFFKKEDLFYANEMFQSFVVLYLIDENKNQIYMNDSWTFITTNRFRKYVRKIHDVINN